MKNHYSVERIGLFSALVLGLLFSAAGLCSAQTTEFAYQGKLTTNFNPANGTYQMEFKLFDAAAGGNQIGATISNGSVSVSQGAYTVYLDFGAQVFSGADRFVEAAARKSASDPYTIISPRQKVTSAPYSIKSKTAETATIATSAVMADTASVATRAFNSERFGGLDVSRFVRLDTNDNVGIGTTSTGSKLAVGGTIESRSGGIKFPDATTQTTAGISSVNKDPTLTGNGTAASPLGVASPLMVRDLDNPARQPFYVNAYQTGTVLTVPNGKRLVIETVTGRAAFYNTNIPADPIHLAVFDDNDLIRLFYIAPSFTQYANGNTVTYYTHSIRLYLSPGDRLFISLPANDSNAHVSGYWVDLP